MNKLAEYYTRCARAIERAKIIVVAVIDTVDCGARLADTLCDAGLHIIEITLRTPEALSVIEHIRAHAADMIVGAGTVLSVKQMQAAYDAGAQFVVSPGIDSDLAAHASHNKIAYIPGIATASDIMLAVRHNLCALKFFHATALGGLPYLRGITAPFAHCNIQFIPFGGLTADICREYLDDPNVMAVGGSWIAPQELIARGQWDEIAARARHTRAMVDTVDAR